MKNEIRQGKVSAVNYATGMVRDKDDSVTREIPMLSNEYNMPAPGDMVLVLHLSNGTEAGVVLGRPWSGTTKPPEGAAGLYRNDLARTPGEAMIRYQDGTLTIKAAQMVGEGNVTVTGSLTINGNLNVTGTITAQSITTSGDVVAGGKSLIGHTHTDSRGGGTTPPT